MDLSYVHQCCKAKSLFHNVDHDESRLVTVDRLAQWEIEVEKTCVLCKNDEETAEHLFLQCSVARTIWGRLLSWIEKQTDVPMI